MGVVYRARRADADADAVDVDVDVALKVIAAGPDASPEALARFQREARIATELDHPGIVKALETGESDGQTWFAMELIEGEPLSTAILEQEFTWQQAVTIVRDVADALAVAHDKGVLHRDINPSNIIMDVDGKPHLTDFGLAKDTRTESKYTRTGQTLGTPAYMSPEQARGDLAQLTPAADTWALGCVLYELLSNRPPFEGDTPAAVIGHVIVGDPLPVPGVPSAVTRLRLACLQKDAHRRYASAAELRDDCDRVLAGGMPQARIPGAAMKVARALLLVLAITGVITAIWMGRAKNATEPPSTVAHAGPSKTEQLAERAWERRNTLPDEAIDGLRTALALEPGRDAWRVRLGLLLWAGNDAEGARGEWERVDDASPYRTAAEFYTGLAWCFARREFSLGGEEAVPHLEWVKQQPGRFASLAQAALEIGHRRNADAVVTLGDTDSWEASLIRAFALMVGDRQDMAGVQRELERVLEIGVQFPWAWSNLGQALQAQAKTEEALRAFDRAIAQDPDDQRAQAARGGIRALRGDLDGAESDFSTVLRRYPDYNHVRVKRLTLRYNRKQWAMVLEDVDKVEMTREALAEFATMRAVALYQLQRFAEAFPAAELATQAAPESPVAWAVLGKCHWALDDHRSALAAFRKALKCDPRHFRSNYQCARLLVGLGQVAPAIALYSAAIEADPKHAGAWADRAVAHRRTGQREKAIADATRAIELDAKMTRAYVCRGLERLRLKQYDAAVADLRTADALEGGRPDVLGALGLCLMMSDQHAEAVKVLELFLKHWAGRSPMEKDVRAWLAEAQAKAGK